ncbi:G-type lectin S-receptor-like serine/threonine-protein kinase At5g24080 [Impatiens glandulifera]|uniref:G-type lectin S-receptor-like serine/threonine-protein kinase At5g24080 n=1 Tax=Impatiens glandulifera TaxID=253017 RepID=UPI001FB053F5|nr:G-type lectin S-receptor-like serine/threonine-protein kinase At5g24080 [Impatiens glandulifera]
MSNNEESIESKGTEEDIDQAETIKDRLDKDASAKLPTSVYGGISLGSRLLAKQDNTAWLSDNRTFAFGFVSSGTNGRYYLAVWFAQLPGDRDLVWSANQNSPVSKDAILELDTTGNLLLIDGRTTVWTSNTTTGDVTQAVMSENGNLILHGSNNRIIWQSFSHPSDTLLPGQPLTVSLELTSQSSPTHGGYYTLKMLQQPTSLSLALSYNIPQTQNNYSYWSGPDISNVTGEVIAILNDAGSFGIVYGSYSDGAVYVYKNDNDNGSLFMGTNQSYNRVNTIRRMTLEGNGNLRLYRWDEDFNGSRQWVSEWAAVSNPCEIAGICGNGICNLDKSKTNASCDCLPGSFKYETELQCYSNSSATGKCGPNHENNLQSQFKAVTIQQTNYFFSDWSVIANYSDAEMVSKCGNICVEDCDCVASVSGLNEEKAYCWILKSLEFGGFEDTGATLFVKVDKNGSGRDGDYNKHGLSSSERNRLVVLPVVLSMGVLIALLCCLLYANIHRRRLLRKALENSWIQTGAPISFSYRDLQGKTNNFANLIGTGGFGSVYKGSLGDGTLIAVKKLEKVLPHGHKEFITEVNTIGSMHHVNLVRLRGYSSEGSHRLLVYEFMKNGSLDKWIFLSRDCRDRLLDWSTRFNIAVGTAKGIAYFHEQCLNTIIHCDIKPENILLDETFCPKVSDFGLAKLMGREHSHVVTMVRGTRGYLAPEWISNRAITVKADVYSFGMLLLEIVGGRRNLDMSYGPDEFFYPGWAFKEMSNGRALKVADRRLGGAVEEEELLRALRVGLWCIQDDISMRPTMGEVVKMLEESVEINMPPIPQTVLELVEEGLENVYKAMKREFNHFNSMETTTTTMPSNSHATCSYSTISPR